MLPRILHPILFSVLIPKKPAHQPSLADEKKLKSKNENEPVRNICLPRSPRSPPPRSILAPNGSSAATGGGRKGKTPKHVLSRLTTDLLPPTYRMSRRNVPPHCPHCNTTLGWRTYYRTWCAGSARGYHHRSEFEYRCGLRDQLGDSVEGYPSAHSGREIVHGVLCAPFPLFYSL